MAISRIVKKINNTNWFFTDNFEIEFRNQSITEMQDINDLLKMCVMSVDIPPLSAPESDIVLGGERRIGVQMFETFRFNIRFRDFDNGTMRKYFEAIWIAQQYEYFDTVKSSVKIIGTNGKVLFDTTEALITTISSIQMDNSTTGIAEFDVSFIAKRSSDEVISEFGSDKISELFS